MFRPRRWGFGAALVFCALVLLFSGGAAHAVRLAWDANAEEDLAGYRVHLWNAKSQSAVDVGNTTSVELKDLTPNTRYYFGVRAYTAEGLVSDMSNVITFVTPPPYSRDTYVGLFGEGNEAGQAGFTMALAPNGTASGRITFAGKVYLWRGVFDADRMLVVQLPAGQQLTLTLQLAPGTSALSGNLSIGGSVAALVADRVPSARAGLGTEHRGRYTAVLASADAVPSDPYGFGVFSVSNYGLIRLTATLPTGQRCSAGLQVDTAGTVPLCISNKSASMFGRIVFRDVEGQSDADATLSRNGGSPLVFRAARYAPPKGMPLLAAGSNIHVLVSTGLDIEGVLSGAVTMRAYPATGELLRFKVSPGSGAFQGDCTLATGKRLPMNGVAFLKGGFHSFGRVRDGNTAGAVTVSPPQL
jgi:Fibronectin type III domain